MFTLNNMPRIAGINIPENKKIFIALTYIYGIGDTLSKRILAAAKVDGQKRVSQLTTEEVGKIREIIEKDLKVEGELRRDIQAHIRRLKDIGAWRGLRHMRKLPVRGQRTKTNTRTVRGNVRKTVGSGRKPAATPT